MISAECLVSIKIRCTKALTIFSSTTYRSLCWELKCLALMPIKYHSGNGYEIPKVSCHILLHPSHLSFSCDVSNALRVFLGYGGHDFSGALLLSGLFTCQVEVLTKGPWASLQESIYLPFVHKLVEGLLQFSALDRSVTILFMKLVMLSRAMWLRRHGLRFLQHGVSLHFHQYAP